MSQSISLNQQCSIVLYERGVNAINEYYFHLNLEKYKPKYSVGDAYIGPLHDIMHIFGSRCYMGPKAPFETEIKILD